MRKIAFFKGVVSLFECSKSENCSKKESKLNKKETHLKE